MQSLKDKLLKAGLVTQSDAQRVDEKPNRAQESRIPKLPPLPGSPAAQREQSARQLDLDKKVRERVNATFVAIEPGPRAFYFPTRKAKARRLDLSEAQAEKLEKGELAVVERPDPGGIEHALVPAAVAKELRALSDKVVRFLNDGSEPVT